MSASPAAFPIDLGSTEPEQISGFTKRHGLKMLVFAEPRKDDPERDPAWRKSSRAGPEHVEDQANH